MAQKLSLSDMQIPTGRLDGFFRGVVEDNKDPNGNGACRIRIFGVHTATKIQTDKDGIPTDQLPWAQQITGLGGNASSSVPKTGSYVFLFFENGNPSQPRYFGVAPGTEKGNAAVEDPGANSFTGPDVTNLPAEVATDCDFKAILTRGASDPNLGTPGVCVWYTVPNDKTVAGKEIFRCKTLELPWRNNLGSKSSFPTGTYTAKFTSQTGGSPACKDTYMIVGTPGRSGCRMHSGGYAGNTDAGYKSDVQGCIILGQQLGTGGTKTQTKMLDGWQSPIPKGTLPTMLKKQNFQLIVQ